MAKLINLQEYYKSLNSVNHYIFENCFIEQDYFNNKTGSNFDYMYNVVYIYNGVKLNGYLRGQKQPNDVNIDGNIWGFYPNAQNDFIWDNFDRYQELKKEYLSKYYMDNKQLFRHSHLGTNALNKTLTHLIDEKI